MNMYQAMLSIVLATIVGLQEAGAQQASSFEQLRVLVKTGDTVSVTDSTGQVLPGKIVDVSSSTLRLQVNGVNRDLSQKEVVEIRQHRGDSLKNGATIGALVGLAIGVLTAVAMSVRQKGIRLAFSF